MPPVTDTSAGTDITVLVTGFGPFGRFHLNPSWEITKSLPSEIPQFNSTAKSIQVITCEQPIRVSYTEARERIQDLLESKKSQINLVLNIGLASGRQFYSIEKYAHRSGYTSNEDLDGELPDPDEPEKRFAECPDRMTTSLGFEALLARWRHIVKSGHAESGFPDTDCRASEDAGRFLCDYTYFNALTWFGRRNEKMEGGGPKDRPVMFFHVPPDSDDSALQRGRAATVALIQAMVELYQSG